MYSNHRIYTVLTSGSYSTLFLPFVPPSPTASMLCLSVLNVTVLLAFSSSILNSTPSESKVLRAGARSTTLKEGKMARERERKRPCASYRPIGHVVDTNVAARRGRLSLIPGHHHQLTVMWHQHVPQQFLTWKASLPDFYFFLVMSHTTNLFWKKRRCWNHSSPLLKAQTKHKTCQWFARRTVMDETQTHYEGGFFWRQRSVLL